LARQHFLTGRARRLRRDSTDAERALWKHLRSRQLKGAKFRRQVEINGHIVDFLCPAHRLIIEVDGGQHSKEGDEARTASLENQGFRIIRFWNNDVLTNLEGVWATIAEALNMPPHPAR
jgi:very-short-patch-repair endonuclease